MAKSPCRDSNTDSKVNTQLISITYPTMKGGLGADLPGPKYSRSLWKKLEELLQIGKTQVRKAMMDRAKVEDLLSYSDTLTDSS